MSGKTNKTNATQSSSNAQQRKVKRSRRRYGRRGKSYGPDGILAGYGSSISSVFSSRATSDGQIVRGYDLLPTFTLGSNISFYLPANPTSWNGTRISAIAAGYQSYRPLTFRIHYRPQVGSNSSTAVFIGTLWQTNYISQASTIEPSLLTSPGGVYTPGWQSSVSTVHCGTYLPQRMFPTRDPHTTTVPFAIIARATDDVSTAVALPGKIFIEYTYEFRNAIGSGTGFSPSEIAQVTVTDGIITPGGSSVPASGVLVDTSASTTTALPIGGLVSWDKISNSVNSFQLLINSTQVNWSGSVTLYIYRDGNIPS